MRQLRPFQIVLIGIFVFTALASLIFIANWRARKAASELIYGNKVEIWGPFPADVFRVVISDRVDKDKAFSVISYQQINPTEFENRFLNAVAENRSPDLIILMADDLVSYRSKILAVSPKQFPPLVFSDTYIEGASIFKLSDGIYARPFAVDPMVMYWNRDLFSRAGLASPPTDWETLKAETAITLTNRFNNFNITQSAVALGEYQNIRNAKAILLMLTLQAGSPLVTESELGYEVALNTTPTGGARPLESALSFFTDFANHLLPIYSWNRALAEDRKSFLAGDLALYFGFGSEATKLRELNPNLNFGLAPVPQGRGATALRNYGRFYGFAIPQASSNKGGAFAASQVLASGEELTALLKGLNLAPVQKSLIAGGEDDFRQEINRAALIARGWLDPRPNTSDNIFKAMIEAITSGRQRISGATQESLDKLKLTY